MAGLRPILFVSRPVSISGRGSIRPPSAAVGTDRDINARVTSHRTDRDFVRGPLEQTRGCRMDKGMRSGPAEEQHRDPNPGLQGALLQRPPRPHIPADGAGSAARPDRLWQPRVPFPFWHYPWLCKALRGMEFAINK